MFDRDEDNFHNSFRGVDGYNIEGKRDKCCIFPKKASRLRKMPQMAFSRILLAQKQSGKPAFAAIKIYKTHCNLGENMI